jgi:hypothetical protein
MTEDIVEFGATAPRRKRVSRSGRPQWMNNRMLPVAAVGGLAGAASLFLPWQKIVSRPPENTIQELSDQTTVETMLISLGAFGTVYLLALIATITAVAMIFYGHQVIPATRVLGATLSGANLVILTATALVFSKGTVILNMGMITFGPRDWERSTVSLEWGFYAALAAVVALGIAALGAQPLTHTEPDEPGPGGEGEAAGDHPEAEDDDGVIDLSVSVHPVGKQVAAG